MLKISPKVHKINAHGAAYARIPSATHQRLKELSEQTGYSIGELIAVAVGEISVATKHEQRQGGD